MNIIAALLLAAVTPLYVGHNDVPGDTQTMTNIEEWAASISTEGGSYSWVRPDDWTISYVVSNVSKTVDESSSYIDTCYRVVSNMAYRVTIGNGGCAYLSILDPNTEKKGVIDSFFAVDTGITIDQNTGVFSTYNDGLFKIGALRGSDVRYVDVASQVQSGNTEITATFYADDKPGTVRKSVNDAAKARLDAATFISSNDYVEVIGGVTNHHKYALYNTFIPRMARTGAGNVSPFAVSQHILASAAHYSKWIRWLGNQTFDDGNGNTATVTKLEWVDLADWARTNGFSEAEISYANIDDLALIRCAKTTAVPDGCIPKFMNETAMINRFGTSMIGVTGWACCQQWQYAIPIVMEDYHTMRASPYYYTKYKDPVSGMDGFSRADICKRLSEMGLQYYVHSGDSGKPVFVEIDGYPVIMTTWAYGTSVSGWGASYVRGYNIIKAFVENYGDTLKGIEQ